MSERPKFVYGGGWKDRHFPKVGRLLLASICLLPFSILAYKTTAASSSIAIEILKFTIVLAQIVLLIRLFIRIDNPNPDADPRKLY